MPRTPQPLKSTRDLDKPRKNEESWGVYGYGRRPRTPISTQQLHTSSYSGDWKKYLMRCSNIMRMFENDSQSRVPARRQLADDNQTYIKCLQEDEFKNTTQVNKPSRMRVESHPSGKSMWHQRFDEARDHLGVLMHPLGKSMPQQQSEKQVYENMII